MTGGKAPYHAHVYYSGEQRAAAERLRRAFADDPAILYAGRLTDRAMGPHPIPQFEVHFLEGSRSTVVAAIEASGLRGLVHPLTDDDLADHTALAHWIGEPLDLDVGTLDPPGRNQGIARFGRTDF